MADETTPSGKPLVIKIQQHVESAEGDTRIVGMSIVVENLNINIIVRGSEVESSQTVAPLAVSQTPDDGVTLEFEGLVTDIVPQLQTWLGMIFGQQFRIESESSDEYQEDDLQD